MMYDATPHPTAMRKEEVMPREFCRLPEPTPDGWEHRNPDSPFPNDDPVEIPGEAESREDFGRKAWTRTRNTYQR